MNKTSNTNLIFGRSVESGLERVSSDHNFLVHSFASVLDSLGVPDAATLLLDKNFAGFTGRLNPQSIQAISFYFQLLNLAEEHGSGRSSREGAKKTWVAKQSLVGGLTFCKNYPMRDIRRRKSGKNFPRSGSSQYSPSIQPRQSAGQCLGCTGKLSVYCEKKDAVQTASEQNFCVRSLGGSVGETLVNRGNFFRKAWR